MTYTKIRPLALAAIASTAMFGTRVVAAQDAKSQDDPQVQKTVMQYFRPYDQRGINVFETSKQPGVSYDGFKIQWGAAFTQQYQSLRHSNTADSVPTLLPSNLVNKNRLKEIGSGFNNAVANLYMNAQLAKGIRVQLTSYLSSRHHNETWVKDGYIQIDESPIDLPFFNTLMKYTTLKVGHFQVNYGDMQFRRSDNGQALYNPFVGNALMDAFTTEIGAEAIVQHNGLLGVIAASSGESRGRVDLPAQRAPAIMFKGGVDKQLTDDLRVRFTGSYRNHPHAISSILYNGDRAGSRYYMVVENTAATESAQPYSGNVNPGFSYKVSAYQFNPFVKFRGAEFFGIYENAKGRGATETAERSVNHLMAEGLYRFGSKDRFYAGGRWNRVNGNFGATAGTDATVTRVNIGGGWFVTPALMAKLEYVTQTYDGFVKTDIRNGAKFNGLMLEGIVAF